MTTTDKQQITILFVPDTHEIIQIFDHVTGIVFTPDKLDVIRNNIYNWAKAIKPSPEQFGDLSSFLMAIKRCSPNGIIYKFTNNGNFLIEYLLGTRYSSNKLCKVFEIIYTMPDTGSGNYHSLQVSFNIRSETQSNLTNNTQKLLNTINYTTPLQLRHELINPLNAIKLSADQIRKHIRKNSKTNLSMHDIDKFNNIILNEVDNSIYIIDTIINENTDTKTNISFDKIQLTTFKTYIQRYLDSINQTYFMFAPVNIEWPTEIEDTNYILTHYVCVNTNYMKIILNNVFKNIYGYIDPDSSKYTNGISSISDNITNNINNKINSTNKFTILINGNEIQLLISNKINKFTCANDIIKYTDLRKCKAMQSIIDKYNLVVDYHEVQYKSNKIISNSNKNTVKSKKNMGIGLTLINNLCNKMDVKWNMIDNETEISFILTIPVLSDTRHLGHFFQHVIPDTRTNV